jgi:adenosylcobinamide-GDP ribazoletransferase
VTGFLFALRFLTIVPVKVKGALDNSRLGGSVAYFPVIGFLLGCLLSGVDGLLSAFLPDPFFVNTVLVVLLIVLTGSLHIDGLADTFDALFSGKRREEMLSIMRDSRIGTMGVVAIVSVVLLKLAFLFSLGADEKGPALILMCVLGRYSFAWNLKFFPYAREDGKAKAFFDGMNHKIFFTAALISLIFSVAVGGAQGAVLFLMTAVFVALAGRFVAGKIGGMTGDTLGAVGELTEVFSLFGILVLNRI